MNRYVRSSIFAALATVLLAAVYVACAVAWQAWVA